MLRSVHARHTECLRHGHNDRRLVDDSGKVYEPGAVADSHTCGHIEGKARLPDSARAEEGDESVLAQQFRHPRQVTRTSDQPTARNRQGRRHLRRLIGDHCGLGRRRWRHRHRIIHDLVREDLSLEFHDERTWIDTELVHQCPPQRPNRGKRVGLTTAQIHGTRQQRPRVLVERIPIYESLRGTEGLLGASAREVDVDECTRCVAVQPVQSCPFGNDTGEVCSVLVRFAPPQPERLVEKHCGIVGSRRRRSGANTVGLPHKSIESGRVQFSDPQCIVRSAAHDRTVLPAATQRIEMTPQLRHGEMKCVRRRRRNVVPHIGEKLRRTHRVRRRDRK